jgi:hypothetical protein
MTFASRAQGGGIKTDTRLAEADPLPNVVPGQRQAWEVKGD